MRNLHAAYTSLPKLRCVFFTIVMRNDSLHKKYPGGLDAFINDHGGQCNDHITVYYDMGADIGDVLEALNGCCLKKSVEFTTLDTMESAMWCCMMPEMRERPFPVDTRVDWLKGQYWNDNVWVWYPVKYTVPSLVRLYLFHISIEISEFYRL